MKTLTYFNSSYIGKWYPHRYVQSTTPKSFLIVCAIAIISGPLRADTVLWNDSVNGSPSGIQPVGTTSSGVNLIEGFGTIVANGGNFIDTGDSFSFIVPTGNEITGMSLTISGNYPLEALAGLWDSPTGANNGTGQINSRSSDLIYTGPGTYNIFSTIGVSDLAAGDYSTDIYTETSLANGNQLSGTGTMDYTLSINTAAAVPEPASWMLGFVVLGLLAVLRLCMRRLRIS